MTTEEDKYIKYLDSLETANSEFKLAPGPEAGCPITQFLPANPTVVERIQHMMNVHGGIENFFRKIEAEEIDLKLVLKEHDISESDLDSLE